VAFAFGGQRSFPTGQRGLGQGAGGPLSERSEAIAQICVVWGKAVALLRYQEAISVIYGVMPIQLASFSCRAASQWLVLISNDFCLVLANRRDMNATWNNMPKRAGPRRKGNRSKETRPADSPDHPVRHSEPEANSRVVTEADWERLCGLIKLPPEAREELENTITSYKMLTRGLPPAPSKLRPSLRRVAEDAGRLAASLHDLSTRAKLIINMFRQGKTVENWNLGLVEALAGTGEFPPVDLPHGNPRKDHALEALAKLS
jgi:hypothetical protein